LTLLQCHRDPQFAHIATCRRPHSTIQVDIGLQALQAHLAADQRLHENDFHCLLILLRVRMKPAALPSKEFGAAKRYSLNPLSSVTCELLPTLVSEPVTCNIVAITIGRKRWSRQRNKNINKQNFSTVSRDVLKLD